MKLPTPACCSWGASLERDESLAIQRAHPAWYVTSTGDAADPVRTTVQGACVFKTPGPAGGCSIHDKPYYPRVCRGFPDHDGTGKPLQPRPVDLPGSDHD